MKKETSINLFLELADSFSEICKRIDADDCFTEKCPFAKESKYGDFNCIFAKKGMNTPNNWIGGEENE